MVSTRRAITPSATSLIPSLLKENDMYVRALAPLKEKASARAPALRRLAVVGINLGLLLGIAGPAHAAGYGMPWEEPHQQVLESVQAPVAKNVAVIIIIVTGLTPAFGHTPGGFRRLIQIIFGLPTAFATT